MNSPFQKQTVCIIDDDPNIQEIYRVKFTQEEFDVHVAGNGEEGLSLVRQKKPDIILLDLQMPVKDGIETLRELKNDAALSQIPVVVLSNQDDEQAFKEVGKLDATRFYLVKALTTPQKAVSIVREVLH